MYVQQSYPQFENVIFINFLRFSFFNTCFSREKTNSCDILGGIHWCDQLWQAFYSYGHMLWTLKFLYVGGGQVGQAPSLGYDLLDERKLIIIVWTKVFQFLSKKGTLEFCRKSYYICTVNSHLYIIFISVIIITL